MAAVELDCVSSMATTKGSIHFYLGRVLLEVAPEIEKNYDNQFVHSISICIIKYESQRASHSYVRSCITFLVLRPHAHVKVLHHAHLHCMKSCHIQFFLIPLGATFSNRYDTYVSLYGRKTQSLSLIS